jgi:hypothetical protein
LSLFLRVVACTWALLLLLSPRSAAGIEGLEVEAESYWGNVAEPSEEGYWGSVYEREFVPARKIPLSLSLDIKQEYDDNIFSDEENVSRDLITSLVPRVRFNSRGLRHAVTFDYRLSVVRYANLDPAPGLDLKDLDYLGHNLKLMAKRMVNERLKVGAEEIFLLSRRPSDMYLATNQISAAKYYRNWLSPFAEYQVSTNGALRFGALFDTLHYLDRFGPSDEDSDALAGDLTYGYRINPKTDVYLDGQATARRYDTSSDYQSRQALFGVRRKLSSRFRGECSFGYQDRNFDEEDDEKASDGGDLVGIARLIGESRKTRLELSFAHYPADLSEEGFYYVVDRGGVDLFYFPTPKVKVAASAYYEVASYDKERGFTESGELEKRSDDRFGGDLLAEYALGPWLSLSAGYARIERDSNLRMGDFVDNRVFFSIKGVLDL